eukprot:3114694-Prymnesium_polylepis.1
MNLFCIRIKSESFCIIYEIVRGSCRAGRVPVKCHFGVLKPALDFDQSPVMRRSPALHRKRNRRNVQK